MRDRPATCSPSSVGWSRTETKGEVALIAEILGGGTWCTLKCAACLECAARCVRAKIVAFRNPTGCRISSRFVKICNPGLVKIFDILGTSG